MNATERLRRLDDISQYGDQKTGQVQLMSIFSLSRLVLLYRSLTIGLTGIMLLSGRPLRGGRFVRVIRWRV